MTGGSDDQLRDLLVELELLDSAAMEKALSAQKADESGGNIVPLAAVIVREGLLPYGLMERVLAHMVDRAIVCKDCKTEAKASTLDPRQPFTCPTCEQGIAPSEVPSELTILESMSGDFPEDMGEEDLSGQVMGGCQLGRKLGEGGMGAVYEATQLFLKRKVAVKILPEYHVRRKGFIQRFLRESRTAAQIVNPNVVQVHDAGREGTTYYIIMEFVEGFSLADTLRTEGALPIEQALEYGRQAALGLAAAAKVGIIHRDIKPDNLRVTPEGVLKVADFGLAKAVEGGDDLTLSGGVVGTPLYMSPEQCQGKDLDIRSDIYSLGATLYHLISGVPPFQGPSAVTILQKHASEEAPPLRSIRADCPAEVESLLARMMAKDPEDRFSSYDDLIRALEEVIGGPPPPPPMAAHKGHWAVPIVVTVVVLAAVAFFLVPMLTQKDPAPPPQVILASLRVETVPEGALVYLDGEVIGRTPFEKKGLTPGKRTLRVELEGFRTVEKDIELVSGEPLERTLALVSLLATLQVRTTPPGARVFLDGLEEGETPLILEDLSGGEVDLRLEMEGYHSHEEKLRLRAGEVVEREIKLNEVESPRALAIKVRIVTEPPGATIRVDGKETGQITPGEVTGIEPGHHAIAVHLAGYEPAEWKETLSAGDEKEWTVELSRKAEVVSFLEGLDHVRVCLDNDLPLRAYNRLEGLIKVGLPADDLTDEEYDTFLALSKDVGSRAPRVDLCVRFETVRENPLIG